MPKNKKLPFSTSNSRPISILPVLGKIMESIVHEQISKYFYSNNLISYFQHAYRKSHSTATALTHMTDDWLREIEKQNIVGTVFLDFSAAFDIIDHDVEKTRLLWL